MSFFVPFFNSDFEYWHLYHKVTFDGPNRRILINPDETDINVRDDIYSSWKEWVKVRDNSKFAQALRNTGGDPLTGTETLGGYFFLLNGWKLYANPKIIGDITLDGNIFQDDASDVFGFTEGVQLMRNRVSSITTIATPNVDVTISGSGLTDEELAKIDYILSMSNYTTGSVDNLTDLNNEQTASLNYLISTTNQITSSLNEQSGTLNEQSETLNYLTNINNQQTQSLAQLIVINNEQTGSLTEILNLSNITTSSLQQIELNTEQILAGSGSVGGLTADQANQLLKLYEIMGLDPTKPLIVSPVARSVDGEISQSISKTGEVVTVTRIL